MCISLPAYHDVVDRKALPDRGGFPIDDRHKTDSGSLGAILVSMALARIQEFLLSLSSVVKLKDFSLSVKKKIRSYWSKKRESEALLTAAWWGNVNAVRELLERGVGVNSKNPDGWTGLMYAAKNGHTEIVRALLGNGADIDSRSKYGTTALMHAAERGYSETLNVLLDNGADVNAKAESGCTALILAAEKGQTEIAKLLLDKGADVAATNLYGKTPLIAAIKNGYLDTFAMLLDHGADARRKASIESREAALGIADPQDRFDVAAVIEEIGRHQINLPLVL